MIEYEEFEKSNTNSIQSISDNRIYNQYLEDIYNAEGGKLIAEGMLSHADSEERNVITP